MEQHLEAKSECLATMSASSSGEALGIFVLSRSANLKKKIIICKVKLKLL